MDNSTLIIQHQFDYDLSPTSSSSPPTTTWPRQLVKHMADRNSTRSSDDPMPSTSDFVKKLYKSVSFSPAFSAFTNVFSPRMLEDPTFQSVVSWGPLGDCFVVKACQWRPYQYPSSYSCLAGHERVHKVHSTTHVQAFQLCQLRTPTKQVRFPQG